MFQAKNIKRRKNWLKKRLFVIENLCEMPDCYFEIKWDMGCTYLPGSHKFFPSDTFKVWKIGSNIRLDFSFVRQTGFK